MSWILARLKEPSSYAGLSGLMVSLHLFGWGPEQWNGVFDALAAIAAAVSIVLGEKTRS